MTQPSNARMIVRVIVLLAGVGLANVSLATYSIVACEANTGRCGVAVATHNLAVGNSVPFAQARIGAGVSQLETNPHHASTVLAALAAGSTAAEALAQALERDGEYPDGAGEELRQLAVVRFGGDAAAFTGQQAGAVAGHRTTGGISVQGNGLATSAVLGAMQRVFGDTEGPLGHRLLTALEAGLAEGGQTIGITSVALLVATPEGWPLDTDLRVDFAPGTAMTELRTAYDASVARTLIFRAERAMHVDDRDLAAELMERALVLAPTWDRIWLKAAHLATAMGDDTAASRYRREFTRLNPVWAEQLAEGP
ncbi:MAG: DUF1028 domain-containing protein [Pseudomonadota bacterium]